MSIVLNLSSENASTLKNFLDRFYEKDFMLEDDVIEWVNVFNEPLEAIDIMTAVMDNKDKFDIKLCMSMDPGLFIDVTQFNIEDIIKLMLLRFYKKSENQ